MESVDNRPNRRPQSKRGDPAAVVECRGGRNVCGTRKRDAACSKMCRGHANVGWFAIWSNAGWNGRTIV
jgi:hypothetical protein